MVGERNAHRRSREAVKSFFSRSSSVFTLLFTIAAFGQFALRFNAKLSGDTGVVVCMKQKDIMAPGGLCRHL